MTERAPAGRPAPLSRMPYHMAPPLARTEQLHGCHALKLELGRDSRETGVSITLYTPSGGVYLNSRLLLARRWRRPIADPREALTVAIQALQEALKEFDQGQAGPS